MDGPAWVIGGAALVVTALTRVNPSWVIIGGAVMGFVRLRLMS